MLKGDGTHTLRPCKKFCRKYLDDIYVFSRNVDEHIEHIKQVLELIINAGFKLNAKKCTWMASKINILGFLVSGSTIQMDSDRISAIKNRKEPTNQKQIQQYLGLTGYYRQFIKNYAEISKPLYELIKKDQKYVWEETQKQAYNKLKQSPLSEPVLAQAVLGEQFIVYSDASNYAIGGVLSQEINDKEHVIWYASRLLKRAELNYGISEKERLTIIFLIKKWRVFLYGTKFKVVTDHHALIHLMTIKDWTLRSNIRKDLHILTPMLFQDQF